MFNVDGADWQREKWGRFARCYLRTCEGMAARRNWFRMAPIRTQVAAQRLWSGSASNRGGYLLFIGRLVP